VYTAAGGKPEEAPHAAQRYVFVTNDRDEALRAADGARYIRRIALSMRNQYARVHGAWLEEVAASDEPPLDVTADRLIVGDAERCAAKLAEEITALRPTHISCFMAIPGIEPKRILESMERFGGEVMPLLTKHFGGFDRVGAAEPRSAFRVGRSGSVKIVRPRIVSQAVSPRRRCG
jgi:alkanesulfonate monooxygenase SsuD/methylene tetrahydromethanopterin reductase-like flavin-dependent oxidoreductase (luciferase family)